MWGFGTSWRYFQVKERNALADLLVHHNKQASGTGILHHCQGNTAIGHENEY
jgi:hypothetical protein